MARSDRVVVRRIDDSVWIPLRVAGKSLSPEGDALTRRAFPPDACGNFCGRLVCRQYCGAMLVRPQSSRQQQRTAAPQALKDRERNMAKAPPSAKGDTRHGP